MGDDQRPNARVGGDQFAAITEAMADDGIDFDGLRLERKRDGYVLEVAGEGDRHLNGEDDLRQALADCPDAIENWYFWHAVAPQKADHFAFLRWLERADDLDVGRRYAALGGGSVARSWGELRLRVGLGEDGARHYAVRHEDDAETPTEELDAYDDHLDVRTLTKFDADGRYRPLTTAPTLRAGWHVPDLGPDELVETVDFVYPATVANWYREREGELDVTHWWETAERQTGIYDLVDELDRDVVERIAESCCVDSQCLKRREWKFDEENELNADGGDGPFPCREPCSLVIAAARTWTKLEREEPRTYEFELTSSEKEQVEEIIDAVAGGRVGEIREADVGDGANRYRARYLRAKLFDGDGNLAVTELDE